MLKINRGLNVFTPSICFGFSLFAFQNFQIAIQSRPFLYFTRKFYFHFIRKVFNSGGSVVGSRNKERFRIYFVRNLHPRGRPGIDSSINLKDVVAFFGQPFLQTGVKRSIGRFGVGFFGWKGRRRI